MRTHKHEHFFMLELTTNVGFAWHFQAKLEVTYSVKVLSTSPQNRFSSVCVCVLRVCVCECVWVCVRVCVRACVCVWGTENSVYNWSIRSVSLNTLLYTGAMAGIQRLWCHILFHSISLLSDVSVCCIKEKYIFVLNEVWDVHFSYHTTLRGSF